MKLRRGMEKASSINVPGGLSRCFLLTRVENVWKETKQNRASLLPSAGDGASQQAQARNFLPSGLSGGSFRFSARRLVPLLEQPNRPMSGKVASEKPLEIRKAFWQ